MREKIVKVFEKTTVYALVAVMAINMAYMPTIDVRAQEVKAEAVSKKETKNKYGNKTEKTVKNTNAKSAKKNTEFRTKKKYPALSTYSSGVTKGTVRYVSQVYDLEKNGWIYKKDGKTYDYTSIAGGECSIASSSMALSYLGIDISPGEFAYNCGGGALYFSTGWAEWRDDVDVRKAYGTAWKDYYDDYKSDDEYKYSPVIIQLTNYFYSNSHYVLVVGKNSDGTYKIYDCNENEEWNATIENGYVYGLGGKVNGSIGQVRQYYK